MEPIGIHFVLLVLICVTLGLGAITVALFGIGWFTESRWGWDGDGWAYGGITVGLFALLSLGILVVSLIPYNPAYWQMYRIEGTVTSVSNVLTEDGGDLSRTPVVTLDSFDQPLTIDDPRAISLEGKHVALRCDRGWVYQGMDRYSCVIQSAR